jgi:hypothetical protein
MGLQITPGIEKPIHIKGTTIELTSVYARASFSCLADGKTISVQFKTYVNHQAFLDGTEVLVDINQLSFDFVILDTEIQSLDVALIYSRNRFIEMGYEALIL